MPPALCRPARRNIGRCRVSVFREYFVLGIYDVVVARKNGVGSYYTYIIIIIIIVLNPEGDQSSRLRN